MSPWASPGQAELLSRVQATDVDGLERAVRGLRRTASEYDRVAGEVNGVRAAAGNYWQAGSQKAFDGYATVLTGNLTDAAAAMRAMADILAAHARATEDAQRSVVAASGLQNAGKYDPDQTNNDSQVQRLALQATHDFHASEQAARAKLWQVGADAPGGIPLPTRPPEAKLNSWQSLLAQSPYGPQFWINGKDMPLLGNPRAYDPEHPLYGFDEDGHKVPAYEADPMALMEKQGAIPLTGIFKLLGMDDGIETAEDAQAAIAQVIAKSDKWRFGRMRKHIREFFHLPGESSDVVPKWAETEYLQMLCRASVRSDRVFEWDTEGSPTWAFLYNETETHRMLVVQFHRAGEKLGQFATAFIPNPEQFAAMMHRATVVS